MPATEAIALPPPPAARSQTEGVYERLRADIVACRLRPSQKLKIADLCEQLEVSLGAVRESLSRLAADGLVVAEAQKGYRVAPMSLADLEDLTATRIEIESLCLRKCLAQGDLQWESQLVSLHHMLSGTALNENAPSPGVSDHWARVHAEFHFALVAACGSPWLLRLRETLFEQSERYRRFSAGAAKVQRDVQAEHDAIFAAAIARDAERTVELMAAHFRETTRIVRLVAFEPL